MNLHEIFDHIVFKKLVAVDLPHQSSHQHEINGSKALREFFNTQNSQGKIEWYYFADDQSIQQSIDDYTFYDARANHPTRTEWRFYYRGDFLRHAWVGDLLVLAQHGTRIFGLIFEQNSHWASAIQILLALQDMDDTFQTLPAQGLSEQRLDFAKQTFLEVLGLEIVLPAIPTDFDLVIAQFGIEFPSTTAMGGFARQQTTFDITDADGTLVRFLEREEQLFRALEKYIVEERLKLGFADIDDFVAYSLSVQNRRKSRMGHALENHLNYIFSAYGLQFEQHAITELKKRPDFLFPDAQSYHDPIFPSEKLVMLGAKSSCKDRWRQVISEADRIATKHLCTLDLQLSKNQLDEMHASHLVVVLPKPLQIIYSGATNWWSLQEFIEYVQDVQNMSLT